MARKLIDQEEAARILGISIDEIGSLRDRKKLFPTRDGGQWKYKPEDVERLRDELKDDQAAGGSNWGGGDLGDIELELNDDLDSILLSEQELGSKKGPSTIIGKPGAGGSEGDIVLAPDKSAKKEPTKPAAPPTNKPKEGSDIAVSGGSGLGLGLGSGIGGSDVKLVASGSDVGKAGGSKTGSGSGGSDKMFGSDALSLSDDELSLVDAMALGEADEPAKPKGGSSKKGGSSVKLDDDDDSVFGGKPGSDVTLTPTDSGIQLISAHDSGLSLDQPLELGGSAAELLELGEDDVISLEEDVDLESATQLKADDDFLLTALDEPGGEDSDSGSQVIALDAEEELSSGMFAPVAHGAAMLEEEPISPLGGSPLVSAGSPQMGASAALAVAPSTPEAPFSTWNVVSLGVCSVMLLLCGMMMYDLMKNMWSWDGAYDVNKSIMDSLGNTVGWFESK